MRRLATTFFLIGLAALGACSSAELASRVWISNHTLAPYQDMEPATYADHSFYTDEFVAEWRAFRDVWQTNDVGLNVSPNVRGQYINTDAAGYRVTTDQPASAPHIMYVFGSSITFGVHLPDWYTLPSALQALFPDYQVISQAALGSMPAAQLGRLRQLNLRPGDVVVWFDGYTQTESNFLEARARYRAFLPAWANPDQSLFFRALHMQVEQGAPPQLATAFGRRTVIANSNSDFETIVDQAARLTTSQGASFFSVIEPSVLFKPMTTHERQIWDNQMPGQFTYMTQAWTALGALPGQIDLSHLFANEPDDRFLDCCHLNDVASVELAGAVADYILKSD